MLLLLLSLILMIQGIYYSLRELAIQQILNHQLFVSIYIIFRIRKWSYLIIQISPEWPWVLILETSQQDHVVYIACYQRALLRPNFGLRDLCSFLFSFILLWFRLHNLLFNGCIYHWVWKCASTAVKCIFSKWTLLRLLIVAVLIEFIPYIWDDVRFLTSYVIISFVESIGWGLDFLLLVRFRLLLIEIKLAFTQIYLFH